MPSKATPRSTPNPPATRSNVGWSRHQPTSGSCSSFPKKSPTNADSTMSLGQCVVSSTRWNRLVSDWARSKRSCLQHSGQKHCRCSSTLCVASPRIGSGRSSCDIPAGSMVRVLSRHSTNCLSNARSLVSCLTPGRSTRSPLPAPPLPRKRATNPISRSPSTPWASGPLSE